MTSPSSPLPYNASTPAQRTSLTQTRAATFVPRPRRPYTFTQLVQLSDGSTYTDSRNHALWQPTDKSLKNVEVDEAGKLAAFRERFGRGFDLAAEPTEEEIAAAAAAAAGGKDGAAAAAAAEKAPAKPAEENDLFDMSDLISGYAAMQPQQAPKEPPKKVAASAGKKGKK
ncbi:50S ribosomal protein [Colletotrichum tofieldiae]|nr:50S ribosomal protein [Colletotrichum tofieldiae]